MSVVRQMFRPHRLIMFAIGIALVIWCGLSMRWDWLSTYWNNGLLVQGLRNTLWILGVSWLLGLFLALWLGLAQAAGPWYLATPAKGFCSVIRGTPLLLQLWMLYYGLGSLFPTYPWLRSSALWPYLREAWPYALLSLTLSAAGYGGEVMRGAFRGVDRGQLEAARAFGMPRLTILRRIWLPLAVRRVLPTLGGEAVLLLKSTPLVATVTVIDIYAVSSQVRQDTYLTYEPLLLLALAYMAMAGIIAFLFSRLERRIPARLA
ncbi:MULTISPECIES: ABC transporter permease [Sinorhizobium]|uniref:ABC transporter permease n=1 Tax=Sinorhizobium americanum TaxID=194963 RepID=A0A2S3YQK3_9HYPH|nr:MULTISPECIES: ABC transporter permease subunit [Sinorhizobium]PDT34707.1 ABC transporter permease [Sinorhizobium sp. FG01]PDT49504.1 ABC transporter permease [Sinorhizobium sp. NG07B]POH33339.1 ABC transporter permease [Sinorhizobium americanum]POH33513.1 ABC transporter permease [Sinorhizobium americanum]